MIIMFVVIVIVIMAIIVILVMVIMFVVIVIVTMVVIVIIVIMIIMFFKRAALSEFHLLKSRCLHQLDQGGARANRCQWLFEEGLQIFTNPEYRVRSLNIACLCRGKRVGVWRCGALHNDFRICKITGHHCDQRMNRFYR